ncbi:MAG: extracellular solute-binding protein [Clostridiales bacterium]|nr:extracellular solute-binding protein [Clostridiales bacterium]
MNKRKEVAWISAFLAVSVLLSSACGKKNKEGEKSGTDPSSSSDLATRVTMDADNPNNNVDFSADVVKADDPFYEVERNELIIPEASGKKVEEDYSVGAPVVVGEYIAKEVNRKYEFPPDVQAKVDQIKFPDEYDEFVKIASEYYEHGIAIFNASGEYQFTLLTDSIDSTPGMVFETAEGHFGMLETTMEDEGFFAYTLVFNEKGEQIGKEPMSYTESHLSSWNGKSMILPSGNILLTNMGVVLLMDKDGKELWCLSPDDRSTISNGAARDAFIIDGKLYLYYVNDWDYPIRRYIKELDETTGKTVGDMIDISKNVPDQIFQGDNACFAVGANGIVKVDLQTGDMEAVINWNETDINWYKLQTDSCKMISEGELCFLEYNEDHWVTDEEPHAYVTHFKRTPTNPHAGKTLLHLSAYGLYDSNLIDLLIDYNIRPDGKARVMTYDVSDDVDSTMPASAAGADMAYKVFLDMKSGSGPDILLNFTDFGEFENENVLCDLNPYIDGSSGINRSEYFDNIFKAFETDGKLFQMPLVVQGFGYLGNADICGDRYGWTYADFLSMCNGLPDGSTAFFDKKAEDFMVEMLSSDISYYVNYATCEAKFDSQEFKDLLEIAKRCEVSRTRQSVGDDYEGDPVLDGMAAKSWALASYLLDGVDNVARYKKVNYGRVSYTGYPSVSGSGFGAMANMSVGISSFSKHQDEAWDFVKYLLEKDSLVELGGSFGIPVSRDAVDEKVQSQVKMIEERNSGTPDDPATASKYSIEDSDIAMYIGQIEHIDRKIANYPAIMNVVKEEAAAYFAGQKSVDDVCAIIQNRVKLILQESQ